MWLEVPHAQADVGCGDITVLPHLRIRRCRRKHSDQLTHLRLRVIAGSREVQGDAAPGPIGRISIVSSVPVRAPVEQDDRGSLTCIQPRDGDVVQLWWHHWSNRIRTYRRIGNQLSEILRFTDAQSARVVPPFGTGTDTTGDDDLSGFDS